MCHMPGFIILTFMSYAPPTRALPGRILEIIAFNYLSEAQKRCWCHPRSVQRTAGERHDTQARIAVEVSAARGDGTPWSSEQAETRTNVIEGLTAMCQPSHSPTPI